MYSSRIWQFRSLNELFITRLIVPGTLRRPKGILVCFVFTQFASPSPKGRLLDIRSEIKSRSVQLGILRRTRLSHFSSYLVEFHLPRRGKRKMTRTKKKVLCPWKCFAPDLKLFEKWLCKYAAFCFLFFFLFVCCFFFSTSDFELSEFPLPFFILASRGVFRIFFIWPRSPEY